MLGGSRFQHLRFGCGTLDGLFPQLFLNLRVVNDCLRFYVASRLSCSPNANAPLVTLLVAVISGAFAFVKIYNIRRKNRIDEFFTAVIEIRNSVTPESSSDERAAAIASIRAMQDRGFELLVDEQLAADESFRIFIELTNDSIEHVKEFAAG